MRLRQIRISGFKSFADLTTIDIPSSIIGIVGPNGCGKSNVIEAVRWALGEGKASDLRCKSMSELIFAGSDTRKQAGRAMVELVFDNTDHTLSGPWGAYSEISVKRLLTRDNTSSYLINNQQVRATDVRELFMGTGLGANSYAIISQGMVTEFAKDTPEKRREYLEEAAGVSKYKKRRREAESNLARTRSNLERVI
ncbi:MAG: AAA family ATPase, partial [Burkholderiaceae bacterium]|nr:AAA family ATPase [Burkholderiaceae bacterium]